MAGPKQTSVIASILGLLTLLASCAATPSPPLSVSALQAREGRFDGQAVQVIGSFISSMEHSIVLDSRTGCSGFALNMMTMNPGNIEEFLTLARQTRDSDIEAVEAIFEGVYYPAIMEVRPPRLELTAIHHPVIAPSPVREWLGRPHSCPTDRLTPE